MADECQLANSNYISVDHYSLWLSHIFHVQIIKTKISLDDESRFLDKGRQHHMIIPLCIV